MTLEDIVEEAMICGLGLFEVYDYTLNEIQDYVSAVSKRHKRKYQNLSVIAFHEAHLIAQLCLGGKKKQHKVYEDFPYWTQEEIGEIHQKNLRDAILSNLAPQ